MSTLEATDIAMMRRTADFEEAEARKDLLRAIRSMESELLQARIAVEHGGDAGHEAMNFGQFVTKFCAASGRLRALKLSE